MDRVDSRQLRWAVEEEKQMETPSDLSTGPWGYGDKQSQPGCLSCHDKATYPAAVTGLVSLEDPPPGLWTAIVSPCPRMASLCVCLCPTLLFLKGHQSYEASALILRPHPQTWPRPAVLGTSAYKFWENMIQSMTLPWWKLPSSG